MNKARLGVPLFFIRAALKQTGLGFPSPVCFTDSAMPTLPVRVLEPA
ncbi:hypothetical protein [Ferrigenium kumadai]|nr:hypothetical protein [Ferrigenium kumadai]